MRDLIYSDALYAHFFNLLPEIGPAKLFRLCEYFGSFKKAYSANLQDLTVCGVDTELQQKILSLQKNVNLEQEASFLNKESISVITYQDPLYPKLLLETGRFPAILYFKGNLPNQGQICLGVVGTRKITTYGRTIMPEILNPLITSGIIVVSGLAYGVDALAHELAVNLHSPTIAVLGGGLDAKSLYPQNHSLLAEKIIENQGGLISEYPPFTPNLKHHFVSRNRIISGLSLGTLIVECSLNSGSLITAQHALDQNRTVYAIPGPIYSENSKGPHNLIKMGARLITSAEDILQDLNLPALKTENENQTLFGNSPAENLILKHIGTETKNLNSLIKESGLSSSEVISALTFLEMKGKIRNLGGQQYILSK